MWDLRCTTQFRRWCQWFVQFLVSEYFFVDDLNPRTVTGSLWSKSATESTQEEKETKSFAKMSTVRGLPITNKVVTVKWTYSAYANSFAWFTAQHTLWSNPEVHLLSKMRCFSPSPFNPIQLYLTQLSFWSQSHKPATNHLATSRRWGKMSISWIHWVALGWWLLSVEISCKETPSRCFGH